MTTPPAFLRSAPPNGGPQDSGLWPLAAGRALMVEP